MTAKFNFDLSMSNGDVIEVAKRTQFLSRHLAEKRHYSVATIEKIQIDGNEAGHHSLVLLIRTGSSCPFA